MQLYSYSFVEACHYCQWRQYAAHYSHHALAPDKIPKRVLTSSPLCHSGQTATAMMTMHESEDELDSDPDETDPLKLERAVSIPRETIEELQRMYSHQRLFANQSKDYLASRRTTVINKLMEIDTEESGIFTVDDVADLLEQLLAEQEHVEQQKTNIRTSMCTETQLHL